MLEGQIENRHQIQGYHFSIGLCDPKEMNVSILPLPAEAVTSTVHRAEAPV